MSRSARHFTFPLVPLLLVLALPIIGSLFWFNLQTRPVNPKATENIALTINRGQSLSSIGLLLQEKQLIRSLAAFRIQVILSGLGQKLQAGDFSLSQRQTTAQIIVALTQSSYDRRVTLLEGWRREEIAQTIVDTFSENNPDYVFNPAEFLNLTKKLEGQLFPDTYSFPKDVTAQLVVDRLTTRFREQTNQLINQSTLSDAQSLAVASLIEREALAESEKPIIAGIIINRLNNDWPLQVDATIQYFKATTTCRLLACDWWPQNITKADLAKSSPYNTYLNQGLPPTPICNPSLTSIQAAYNPVPTSFWFYLHDSNGQVHFAKTIEEHNQNIAKYLK